MGITSFPKIARVVHLRFTWQAWRNLTSTVVLRGRRGTHGAFTHTHTICHTHTHTYIHTYIHPSIHPSMHACMHACMHAYIQSRSLSGRHVSTICLDPVLGAMMKQVCWHSRRSKAYRGLPEARMAASRLLRMCW